MGEEGEAIFLLPHYTERENGYFTFTVEEKPLKERESEVHDCLVGNIRLRENVLFAPPFLKALVMLFKIKQESGRNLCLRNIPGARCFPHIIPLKLSKGL